MSESLGTEVQNVSAPSISEQAVSGLTSVKGVKIQKFDEYWKCTNSSEVGKISSGIFANSDIYLAFLRIIDPTAKYAPNLDIPSLANSSLHATSSLKRCIFRCPKEDRVLYGSYATDFSFGYIVDQYCAEYGICLHEWAEGFITEIISGFTMLACRTTYRKDKSHVVYSTYYYDRPFGVSKFFGMLAFIHQYKVDFSVTNIKERTMLGFSELELCYLADVLARAPVKKFFLDIDEKALISLQDLIIPPMVGSRPRSSRISSFFSRSQMAIFASALALKPAEIMLAIYKGFQMVSMELNLPTEWCDNQKFRVGLALAFK